MSYLINVLQSPIALTLANYHASGVDKEAFLWYKQPRLREGDTVYHTMIPLEPDCPALS